MRLPASVLVLLAAVVFGVGGVAAADYSPRMPPGHLRCRHAAWLAAEACRDDWPEEAGRSVQMRITVDRRGRVARVQTEPLAPAFAQCVYARLREGRYPISRRHATEVVSRYVFPSRAED